MYCVIPRVNLLCVPRPFGIVVWLFVLVQSVSLVTKEVDLGTYQDTLLEMQDVVQVFFLLVLNKL